MPSIIPNYLWGGSCTYDSELIKHIYEAQKCLSVKGNWSKLVEAEREKYDIMENDAVIAKMSREKFKASIQKKI